jgi:NADPH2:quinone reductase
MLMKALQFKTFGGIDAMHTSDIPIPEPLADEVQIKVEYAAINPVDWKLAEGVLKDVLPHEFPITVGWDVSGIVSKVGSDVKNFRMGDPVFAYCRKAKVHDGTFCEYVTFSARHVVLKPKSISFEQAAATPLCALTAWQALFDVGKLQKGESILIHAGAGGVGSFAIQFAKWIGAKVYTTASEANHSYVKMLGATVAIDYKKENFVQAIHKYEPAGVDFVFDCVGGKVQEESFNALKQGGRFVSIVESPNQKLAREHGVAAHHVFVRPNGEQLKEIGRLYDSSLIEPPEITIIPFEKVKEALQANRKSHTKGKIVVKL